MSKPSQDQPENDAKQSTDRELWRERPDDYYADSLHVTATGGIGINCGGSVLVMPLRQWHALASSAPAPVTVPADPTAKLNQADVRLIAEHAMGEDDEAVENAGIRVMIALDGGIAHLKATAKPLDVAASGSQGEGVAQASSGNADYEPLVPLPGAAPTYEEGLQALAHAMRKLLPPALLAEVLSYLDPMTPFLDYVRTFRSGIPAGAAPPASSITAEAFREALISLREDLTCRHGYNHYCPNCDGSLDAEKILDRFKAIVYASPAPSAPPQEPKD